MDFILLVVVALLIAILLYVADDVKKSVETTDILIQNVKQALSEIDTELMTMQLQTDIFEYLLDIEDKHKGYTDNLKVHITTFVGADRLKREVMEFNDVQEKINYLKGVNIVSYKASEYAKVDIIISQKD